MQCCRFIHSTINFNEDFARFMSLYINCKRHPRLMDFSISVFLFSYSSLIFTVFYLTHVSKSNYTATFHGFNDEWLTCGLLMNYSHINVPCINYLSPFWYLWNVLQKQNMSFYTQELTIKMAILYRNEYIKFSLYMLLLEYANK